jgi:hypothetical protein
MFASIVGVYVLYTIGHWIESTAVKVILLVTVLLHAQIVTDNEKTQ